jgi:hypothetical protein
MLLARQRGVTQMSPVHLKKAPLAGIAPALATAVLATARLAQLVERKALNLVVVGSSPTVGVASSFPASIMISNL